MNPFRIGQKVVCVRRDFRFGINCMGYKAGDWSPFTPYVGEVLTVDAVHGEYLEFERYNGIGGEDLLYEHTAFRAVVDQPAEAIAEVEEVVA